MRIHVGDEIEYVGAVTVHGCRTDPINTHTGTVLAVTDKFITVKGKRYPDTILINDIKSHQVQILKVNSKEGCEVTRNTRYSHIDWVAITEQAQEIITQQEVSVYKAASIISREIKVPAGTVYNRLREAGLDSNDSPDDIVNNNTEEQVELVNSVEQLKRKWIKDVLNADLSINDQLAVIEKVINIAT